MDEAKQVCDPTVSSTDDVIDVLLNLDKRKKIAQWLLRDNHSDFDSLISSFRNLRKRVLPVPDHLVHRKNSERIVRSWSVFLSTHGFHPQATLTDSFLIDADHDDDESCNSIYPSIFELPTKQSLQVVRDLMRRVYGVRRFDKQSVKLKLLVLEVGAGIGLWTRMLRETCDSDKFDFIATDKACDEKYPYHTEHRDESNPTFDQSPIEILDFQQAIEKYKARDPVVMWSWVPPDLDPTPVFADAGISTILYIGPGKNRCCGKEAFSAPSSYNHHFIRTKSVCATDTFDNEPDFRPTFHSGLTILSKELAF